MKTTSIKLPETLHSAVKIAAVKKGLTLQDFIIQELEKGLRVKK